MDNHGCSEVIQPTRVSDRSICMVHPETVVLYGNVQVPSQIHVHRANTALIVICAVSLTHILRLKVEIAAMVSYLSEVFPASIGLISRHVFTEKVAAITS